MGRRKLSIYRGKLSPAEISAGMNAANKNAHRLAEDAEALFKLGRFPTAASLAILSIEESGKTPILKGLSLATSDEEIAAAWKEYRTHTRKNVLWLVPQLAFEGANQAENFLKLFDDTSDHPFILDQVKQLGFYTDCLGEGHWAIPVSVVDEKLAEMLVQTAKILLHRGEEHTAKEIELWIEYMKPAKEASRADLLNRASADWYAAMQRAGLRPEGPNEVEEFIYYGLRKPS